MIGLIYHWSCRDTLDTIGRQEFSRYYGTIISSFRGMITKSVVVCKNGEPTLTGHRVTNLNDAFKIFPNDIHRVYVQPWGCPISDFQHPDNAVYIFGPDYGSMKVPNGYSCISLPVDDVWSFQAISMVLYDRLMRT